MADQAISILLVEDEEAHAELIRRAFERRQADYAIDVAATLALAQDYLAAGPPDLIICDYVLPDGRGTDLVKSLDGHRQFPLIMMTAHGDEALAVEAMRAGALDYVVKSDQSFAQMPRIADRALREWDHLVERRRVEEELRLFQSLIDQSNDAMYITETRTGRIVYANQSAALTGGFSLGELTAMQATDIDLRLPDEETSRSLTVDGLDESGYLLFESEHRRKDGSTYPVELSIRTIRQGDKQYSVTSARDITERKEADTALEYERAQFLALFDGIEDVMYVSDPDTYELLYVNPSLRESWGEEVIGKKCYVVLQNRDAPCPFCTNDIIFGEKLGRTHVWEFQNEVTKKWYRCADKAIRWADGRMVRFEIAADITERKEIETELRKWWQVFEKAKWGIATSSLEGKTIELMNPAFAEMHGWTVEELVGRPIKDVYAPEARRELDDHIRLIDQNGHHSFESKHIRKDGSVFPVLVDATVVEDSEGSTLYRAVNVLDLTEFKQLEAQLIQAQKMEAVGRLAGGVAHDFNNLLTIINGYAELVLGLLAEEAPGRDEIEEIHGAGLRAAALTSQLLAFSRRQILQPQVLEVNAVISNLEKMLGRLIGEDVELNLVLDPEVGCIHIDPGQLEQVVLNLAVNARDAMPEGGSLTLRTEAVKRVDRAATDGSGPAGCPQVVLAISDTGVGMDQEVMQKIFEPFFTTKEKDRGTGLGLSTVFEIVKQGGGHIEAFSELGQGTTFKVLFPRVAESNGDLRRRRPARAASPTGTETILLVEDDTVVRNLAARILKRSGHKVLTARSGWEALEVCSRHEGPIHLLLSDVVMPQISGPELAKMVTAVRKDIKVLFMSGYTDDAIGHHGALQPGVNLLSKPFSPEDLVKNVRRVLDG
jgi:PAS domain S-box-containing protein